MSMSICCTAACTSLMKWPTVPMRSGMMRQSKSRACGAACSAFAGDHRPVAALRRAGRAAAADPAAAEVRDQRRVEDLVDDHDVDALAGAAVPREPVDVDQSPGIAAHAEDRARCFRGAPVLGEVEAQVDADDRLLDADEPFVEEGEELRAPTRIVELVGEEQSCGVEVARRHLADVRRRRAGGSVALAGQVADEAPSRRRQRHLEARGGEMPEAGFGELLLEEGDDRLQLAPPVELEQLALRGEQ